MLMKKTILCIASAISLITAGSSLNACAAEQKTEKKAETYYLTQDVKVYNSPSDKATSDSQLLKRTELKVASYRGNFAVVTIDGKQKYVQKDALTKDKSTIWDAVDKTEYTRTETAVYGSLKDAEKNAAADTLPACSELTAVRTNGEYTEVSYLWNISDEDGIISQTLHNGYVKADQVSAETKYHFEDTNYLMYVAWNENFYNSVDAAEKELKIREWNLQSEHSETPPAVIEEADYHLVFEQGTPVVVTGTNESGIYRIEAFDQVGYILKTDLTEMDVRMHPYLTASAHSNIVYSEKAMQHGLCGVEAEVQESDQTEENIYFLAQLIECEAGGEGFDGMRAVATVVVNRAYVPGYGDNIHDVIVAPNQFSPVGNGKVYRTTPSQDAYDAAYDVLINGYRSFPCYVLSFQSIRDGYWSWQTTYLTTYSSGWAWPQYFSYNMSDYYAYGYGSES